MAFNSAETCSCEYYISYMSFWRIFVGFIDWK